MNENMQLKDEQVLPTVEALEKGLEESYPVFSELTGRITGPDYDLTTEWRYYRDGKAWLFKAVHKKKTIFWLSAWDGYFKTTFYFTEKATEGIASLNIRPELKETFFNAKSIGKLIPLTIDMRKMDQLPDLLELVKFKKSMK
jgi:hypothetical protein